MGSCNGFITYADGACKTCLRLGRDRISKRTISSTKYRLLTYFLPLYSYRPRLTSLTPPLSLLLLLPLLLLKKLHPLLPLQRRLKKRRKSPMTTWASVYSIKQTLISIFYSSLCDHAYSPMYC